MKPVQNERQSYVVPSLREICMHRLLSQITSSVRRPTDILDNPYGILCVVADQMTERRLFDDTNVSYFCHLTELNLDYCAVGSAGIIRFLKVAAQHGIHDQVCFYSLSSFGHDFILLCA